LWERKDKMNILACPSCQGELEKKEKNYSCKKCKKKFQIKEGIPILILKNRNNKYSFDPEEYYDKIYGKEINMDTLKELKRYTPFKNLLKRLVKKFALKNKKKGVLLSVGCGIGEFEEIFEKENYEMYGTDISFNSLKIAKEYSPKSKYFKSTAEKLPVRSSSIDILLSIDMLEHVFDYTSAVAEMSRVIKKEGILLLVTGFSDKKETVESKNIDFNKEGLGEGGDLRVYGTELIDDLKQRGFSLVTKRSIHGPLTRKVVDFKKNELKKRGMPKYSIIKNNVLKRNKKYKLYSRIIESLYTLDYIIFGKRNIGVLKLLVFKKEK